MGSIKVSNDTGVRKKAGSSKTENIGKCSYSRLKAQREKGQGFEKSKSRKAVSPNQSTEKQPTSSGQKVINSSGNVTALGSSTASVNMDTHLHPLSLSTDFDDDSVATHTHNMNTGHDRRAGFLS